MNLKSLLVMILSFFFYKEGKATDTTTIYPSADMYFGDRYATTAQNGTFLRIGGWGDVYRAFWKFEWRLVRKDREVEKVILELMPNIENNNMNTPVTSATLWLLGTAWKEKTTKSTDRRKAWNCGVVQLDRNTGGSVDITYLYEYWVKEKCPNHGIMLTPNQNDNQWFFFHSRESKRQDIPRVVVHYKEEVPDFKLPLPGGKSWHLTVQAGGKDHDGQIDIHHTGRQYYSLDFSPASQSNGQIQVEQDVPILAIGDGVVYEAEENSEINGGYVRIDHDGDGNPETGFQSVYLHMSEGSIAVNRGDQVVQGQKLGSMGNTGISFGVHLHLTIYHKNEAGTLLRTIPLDGRTIGSYKVGTRQNPLYYESTNIEGGSIPAQH